MTFPVGIDCRATSGFVTDPANCFFCGGSGTNGYPHTDANGNTWGWESSVPNTVDRTAYTGTAARVSGINYSGVSTAAKFRFDLPATGSYQFRLACGDAGGSNTGGPVTVFDTTTQLSTLVTEHDAMTSDTFYDATDTLRTSHTDWDTNNALSASQTFATTIARLQFGTNTSGIWVVAHMFIQAASGGGGTAVTATVGIETWAGQTAALNIQTNVAATKGLETWTGQTAALNILTNVAATSGLETWAGNTASVKFNTAISVGSGLETWSGLAATVTTGGAAGVKKAKVFRVGKRVIYGG